MINPKDPKRPCMKPMPVPDLPFSRLLIVKILAYR